MMRLLAVLLPLMVLLASCSGSGNADKPVPRRHAYPRIHLYTNDYQNIGGVPSLEINRSAIITSDSVRAGGSRWLTLSYPHYNGAAYLTFLPTTPENFSAAVDNRLERIGLNAGGSSVENISFLSEGEEFHCELFTARGESVSPVQFLAYNNSHTLLGYGTFNFAPGVDLSKTDSVSPVINTVRLDMIHLLKNLDK